MVQAKDGPARLLMPVGGVPMNIAVDFGPLVHTLSKVQYLLLVPASSHAQLDGVPHFCWRATEDGMEAFRSLPQVLAQFSGKTEWYLIGDLPRICVFAQPKGTIEPTEQELGEFTENVKDDIPRLAAFIEQAFGLGPKASLMFEKQDSTLDLPLMTDYFEPNTLANILLVRDPDRFLQRWGPTSVFDRSLHCGLTAEDYGVIRGESDKMSEQERQSSSPLAKFFLAILSQRSAVVRSDEVEGLERQLDSETVSNPVHDRVIKKLASICRSARNYDLGILIQFH